MSLIDALMARAGDTGPAPTTVLPRLSCRASVSYTSEFRRIEALPRRRWETQLGRRLIELLTSELRTPTGTMGLWSAQAAALRDITLYRGAFLPIGVGQGKALISLLAPAVLEAKRPLLVVPAQLREQTKGFVIPRMKEHWRLHPDLVVIGYSELSLAKNAKLLEELNPDLIIFDECHRVKDPKAGRTRRLIRWFKRHPETLCVAMSGTISNRSLRDFAHIARWCLKGCSPLPDRWIELTEWADAIDEKVPEQQRVGAGALERFCEPGENSRQGFRRRLTETPGVVATSDTLLGTSLRIAPFKGLEIPLRVEAEIRSMRRTWTTPNDDLIVEAVDLWRHLRELSLGFWYRWDPAPPLDWLMARKEWKKYVRSVLAINRRGLDTELQVWRECEKTSCPEWLAWKVLKDAFKPRTVPEWIDDFAVNACCEWLVEPGICWTEQVAFGRRLAEVSGLPYFGAGDDGILTTDAPSIIASQLAHAEGKNLERWNRNLVTSAPASGKTWEQLLGRTHRQGQEADEVTCEVFLHVPELLESFGQAMADARYLEDTFGNRQKLNYADVDLDIVCRI